MTTCDVWPAICTSILLEGCEAELVPTHALDVLGPLGVLLLCELLLVRACLRPSLRLLLADGFLIVLLTHECVPHESYEHMSGERALHGV